MSRTIRSTQSASAAGSPTQTEASTPAAGSAGRSASGAKRGKPEKPQRGSVAEGWVCKAGDKAGGGSKRGSGSGRKVGLGAEARRGSRDDDSPCRLSSEARRFLTIFSPGGGEGVAVAQGSRTNYQRRRRKPSEKTRGSCSAQHVSGRGRSSQTEEGATQRTAGIARRACCCCCSAERKQTATRTLT